MDLTLDVGEVTTDEIAELSAENLVGVWLKKEKKNINFFYTLYNFLQDSSAKYQAEIFYSDRVSTILLSTPTFVISNQL